MTSTLLITNARIWTGDAELPWASAMRIEGGRIVAIGDETGSSEDVQHIDAAGAVVTPGLIDAHLHLLTGGEFLGRLDLSQVRSRDAFERAIASRHAELPPDEWLIAYGWTSENWPDARDPDKSWLRAAGDRPVVCYRMDLHAALVNDAVLRLIDTMREPDGGHPPRRADGSGLSPHTGGQAAAAGDPTGLMVEAAAWELVNPLVPHPSAEQEQQHLRMAQQHLHALGVTAVGAMEYQKQVEQVFIPLRDELTLRCCVTLLDRDWPLDVERAVTLRERVTGDWLRVIGCKAFIDGTLGSRTARLFEDYVDDPGNRGLLVELAKDGHLQEWARLVAAAGFSPSMHAIGDAAVRMALDACEAVGSRLSAVGEIPIADSRQPAATAPRMRIEHAQTIHPDDVKRFAGSQPRHGSLPARVRGQAATRRQAIASMQPLHKADDGRYAAARLGEHRMGRFFPFRALLDAGAVLAFGSDWPVVSADPLQGMRAAITGLTLDGKPCCTEQNLTVEESLRAYTRGAAHALQLDEAGVLRPGAFGDCVLFDRDPFAADWAQDPPRITTTIVGGNVVYDAHHRHGTQTHASR